MTLLKKTPNGETVWELEIIEGHDGWYEGCKDFSDGNVPTSCKSARVEKSRSSLLWKKKKCRAPHKERNRNVKVTFTCWKNVVAVVLQRNNFEVHDLGVMVSCDEILKKQKNSKLTLPNSAD